MPGPGRASTSGTAGIVPAVNSYTTTGGLRPRRPPAPAKVRYLYGT